MASKDPTKHLPIAQIEKLLTSPATRERGIKALRQFQTWGEAAVYERLAIKHKLQADPAEAEAATMERHKTLRPVKLVNTLAKQLLRGDFGEEAEKLRHAIGNTKRQLREGAEPSDVVLELTDAIKASPTYGKALVAVIEANNEAEALRGMAAAKAEDVPPVENGPADDKAAKKPKKKRKKADAE